MKEAALIIVKPDGISRGLIPEVLSRFYQSGLEIVAMKMAKATKQLAKEHYRHIRGKPFFNGTISYFVGKASKEKKLLAVIFYGENAIKKCRKIAGATNPREADPRSIRGSYGRVTAAGVYENVVHVSSDKSEARREIKLWFAPDEISAKLYPSRIRGISSHKERVWK